MRNYIKYIILTMSILTAIACQSQSKQRLKVNEFEAKLKDTANVVLVDVRTAGEFNSGYIENAINADYNNGSLEKAIKQWDKSKTYLLYCKSGGRSSNAVKLLQKEGFANVYDLEGGITAWVKEDKNLVVEK